MTDLRGSIRARTSRFGWWLKRGQWTTVLGIGLAVIAVVSGIATYLILTGAANFMPTPREAQVLLLANLAIVLTLLALIAYRLVRLWRARRAGSAGARLHVRLVAMFSFVAVLPAIIVAVFATTTLDRGLDYWFSDRIRTIADNAETVAQAYLVEHRNVLRADALLMAKDLNRYADLQESNPAAFQEVMTFHKQLRSLAGAFLADSRGHLLNVAEGSAPTRLDPPPPEELDALGEGEALMSATDEGDQVQALVRLTGFDDAFLLVSRTVDPRVLEYLARTEAAAQEYADLESGRYAVQVTFALIYVIVALLVLLAAIWFGLWAANRMVEPIGQLVGAAERVSDGDLAARIDVGRVNDEISTLGRTFNRMTGQLQSQRNELMEANRQLDRRRRFTEAVLAGVSAGVVGLDARGRINLVNRTGTRLLGLSRDELIGQPLIDAVPEMAGQVRQAMARPDRPSEGQVTLAQDDTERTLTVRVTSEVADEGARGFVVTFDDISELVSAQRTSAWADIARRIAHEIKNPLTPIQLSAERLKRKYGKEVTSDPQVFEQCTNTIIRQVEDLGRMVDEFSSFARMPKAAIRNENLSEIVRESVFLQKVGQRGIRYEMEGLDEPVSVPCDRRLVGQALTNLLKNAAEAIQSRRVRDGLAESDGDKQKDRIFVRFDANEDTAVVEVMDTGIGLPRGDRHRLVEPYITTREKGTGLGLAIVKKIMEEHGGTIALEDAPWPDEGETGALIRLTFPRRAAMPNDNEPADHAADEESSERIIAHGS